MTGLASDCATVALPYDTDVAAGLYLEAAGGRELRLLSSQIRFIIGALPVRHESQLTVASARLKCATECGGILP